VTQRREKKMVRKGSLKFCQVESVAWGERRDRGLMLPWCRDCAGLKGRRFEEALIMGKFKIRHHGGRGGGGGT